MVNYNTKYVLAFNLSDIKWSEYKGENSGFFVDKIIEVTGYKKVSYHFPIVLEGQTPLSAEQITLLGKYINI